MSIMPFAFSDATRDNILIKMALCGPPGSGKSRSGLGIATYLAKALDLGEVFAIDSENGSLSKYAYNPKTGKGFRFKALNLPTDDYSPQMYMKAIKMAEDAGARMLLIDSLSHAWNGVKGILEQVNQITEASRSKNAFSEGWNKMTPVQRRFVQTILNSSAHIIVTMRSDPEWVVQENERGKKEPVMLGLSPQQRKDISFEFDIVIDIKQDHTGVVSKTRCEELNENSGVYKFPGENVGHILAEWVSTSDRPLPEPAAAPAARPAAPQPGATDPAAKALASDIERRIKAAESTPSLDDLEPEIKNLPELLRPRLRVQLHGRRVDFAMTPDALDTLGAAATAQRFGDKGAEWLTGRVAARRADVETMQAPAAAQ